MATFWGAETAAVRELGTSMSSASRRLEDLFEALDRSVLREEIWVGSDAQDFRSLYSSNVRTAASVTSASLQNSSIQLDHEASEQDDASATAGSPTPSTLLDSLPVHHAGHVAAADVSTSLGFWDHRGDERSARRGEGRENSRSTDGDGSANPHAGNPNAQYSTPGPQATAPGDDGLGAGVPGTQTDAPEPPAWTPPADGAGEHNSEIAGPIDHATHSLAREGADLKRGDWPNASEHLDHFLDNSGDDYPADVDSLLSDQPAVAQAAAERRHQAGHDAVTQAQSDGVTGPTTYPLSTAWDGHTATGDWFYASGSFDYNQTGTVTVHPPDANNPEWRYEVDTQVNFRDRYNWDGGKQTQIGPFTVTDESLAALHRGGIAREYNLIGESSDQHSAGSIP